MSKSRQAPSAGFVAALHSRAVVVNGLSNAPDLDTLLSPMLEGGVTAVNWTIAAPCVESIPSTFSGVARFIASIRASIQAGEDRAILVRTADDIRRCKASGKLGVILGFQDASPFEDSVELLGLFHHLGVRIVQLTYQRRNLVGDGCGEPTDSGLSLFGRDIVRAMNRLGMLIDLSHCGPRTSLEAVEWSEVPCALTHANLAEHHRHVRNKSNELIQCLAAKGGIIGIAAISRYVSETGNTQGTTLADIVDQVDSVVSLVGVDHVGFGLDITEGMTEAAFHRRLSRGVLSGLPELRGSGEVSFENYYPVGLRSACSMPRLTDALLRRGYGDADVLKILGGNWLRVFDTVWFSPPSEDPITSSRARDDVVLPSVSDT